MSNTEPPLDVRTSGRPPHDLDGLLRAFFRAELPHPWPAVQVSEQRSPFPQRHGTTAYLNGDDRRPSLVARIAPRSWSKVRSRLALAATVALLLLGTVLMSGRFHLNPRDADFGQPAAPRDLERRLNPDLDLDRIHMRESIVQPGNQPTEYHIDFVDFPAIPQP